MLDHDVDQLLTTPTQPNYGMIMTYAASYLKTLTPCIRTSSFLFLFCGREDQ